MHTLALPQWNTAIRWTELPGRGVPLVCLPGLSFGAVANFLPLVTQPQFQDRHILMIDYVGSGFSGHSDTFTYELENYSTAIAAVIQAACAGPVDILGYSMGGAVGIALALSRPDLVAKLLVCEGNLTPGGGVASRRIAACELATFITKDHPSRTAKLALAAHEGDRFASFLWAARNGADPRGIHGNACALVNIADDFEERVLALPQERHFVYGALSVPKNAGAATADAPDPDRLTAHGVGVHVVPGVGHPMMIDAPQATARVLAAAL